MSTASPNKLLLYQSTSPQQSRTEGKKDGTGGLDRITQAAMRPMSQLQTHNTHSSAYEIKRRSLFNKNKAELLLTNPTQSNKTLNTQASNLTDKQLQEEDEDKQSNQSIDDLSTTSSTCGFTFEKAPLPPKEKPKGLPLARSSSTPSTPEKPKKPKPFSSHLSPPKPGDYEHDQRVRSETAIPAGKLFGAPNISDKLSPIRVYPTKNFQRDFDTQSMSSNLSSPRTPTNTSKPNSQPPTPERDKLRNLEEILKPPPRQKLGEQTFTADQILPISFSQKTIQAATTHNSAPCSLETLQNLYSLRAHGPIPPIRLIPTSYGFTSLDNRRLTAMKQAIATMSSQEKDTFIVKVIVLNPALQASKGLQGAENKTNQELLVSRTNGCMGFKELPKCRDQNTEEKKD